MEKQSSHTDLGKTGERRAALYLERKGYRILRYNYRCPFGEIDLIALDPSGEILCFIEVKTRSGTRYGSPWEAVSGRKRSRIRRGRGSLPFPSSCMLPVGSESTRRRSCISEENFISVIWKMCRRG